MEGVTGSIPVAPTIFKAPDIASEERFPGLLLLLYAVAGAG